MEKRGLLLNLDRCVGCYSCELACKQENNLSVGTNWISLITLGPKRVNGKMCMDFFLDISNCTFCQECVEACPTEALEFCDGEAKILDLLTSGKRYQICYVG